MKNVGISERWVKGGWMDEGEESLDIGSSSVRDLDANAAVS
jgi:hypothetical protein